MSPNKKRAEANVRERKRTQTLNKAYKQLQSIIPKEPSDKMSKIHTLRLTLAYIDFLNNILKEGEPDETVQLNQCQHSHGHLSRQAQASSPYTLNSPGSSNSHFLYLSSTTSEGDEEELTSVAKRLKTDYLDQQEAKQFSPATTLVYSPQPNNTHYIDSNNSVTNLPPRNISCGTTQSYANQYHNSSTNSIDKQTNNGHVSNDLTVSLRNAFREYRSIKRKRLT